MKRYTDLPFRWKILLIFGIAMVSITLSLTVLTSVTTSRFVAENAAANLEMLTEQSLMNFVSVTDRLARSLVDQLSSRQIPADLYALGHTDKDSATARELRQTLTPSLTQMLYAPYG